MLIIGGTAANDEDIDGDRLAVPCFRCGVSKRSCSSGASAVCDLVCTASRARIKSAMVVFSRTSALLSSVNESIEKLLLRPFDVALRYWCGDKLNRD